MPRSWPFSPLEPHKYKIVLCDPPWAFSSGPSRNPRNHYPTMKVEEIKALPVRELAHPDGCRLHLWLTMPFLHRMPEILKAWGFRYSTARVWGKLWRKEDGMILYPDSFSKGTGYEVIGNCELLVIAKRGKVQPIKGRKPGSLFFAQRREHSRKPDMVRDEIARMFDGPRCELFARSAHSGFDVWGNQTNRFDVEAAA